jgi:hypothetical protein
VRNVRTARHLQFQPTIDASQGVARKLAMQPERRTTYADFDHLIYALAREAWKARQQESDG